MNTSNWYLGRILEGSNYLWPFLMFRNVMGLSNIKVVRNQDLRKDANKVMKDIFEFLNLEPIEDPSFQKMRYSLNSNKNQLSSMVYNKLKKVLYPAYRKFASLNKLDLEELKENEESEILKGKDGYLFLAKGANDVIKQYRKDSKFIIEKLPLWVQLLQDRYHKLKERKIQYALLVVPNKLSIYSNKIPDNTLIDYSAHPYIELFKVVGHLPFFIDVLPALTSLRDDTALFWKTDTHWSPYGCFESYKILMNHLGLEPILNLLEQRSFKEGSVGFDLGSKINPPIREKGRFYTFQKQSKRIYANELVKYKEKKNLTNGAGLHVGSHIIFKNESGIPKKVVLFGDSFSEYRTSLLTGMMAETFEELHFIWSTDLDYEYIFKIQPDIVISQVVERFLLKVPNDNLIIEKFAKEKLDQYTSKTKDSK